MKRFRVGFLVVILVLLFAAGPALSQEDLQTCPEIAHLALDLTSRLCEAVGRNQACYGHVLIDAAPQQGVAEFKFNEEGDITDLIHLRSLRLSPMDLVNGLWGMSLMRLQANLPDVSPRQNVTFLAFGDVEIENAAPQVVAMEVSAATESAYVTIRQGPTTESAVLGALAPGEAVTANGRLADGSWLRIRMPETGDTGWVYAPLMSGEGDLSALDVVDPWEPYYAPFQAFYFRSGVADSPCAEAPESGLLVQTPEGIAEVRLLINEVAVRLGSTAFLQAQPGSEMTVSLLEGSAQVQASGVIQDLLPGTQVSVPLDQNLAPAGPPGVPEPYDMADLQALPLDQLERSVTIPPPLGQESITEVLSGDGGDSTGQAGAPTATGSPTATPSHTPRPLAPQGGQPAAPTATQTPTPTDTPTPTPTDTPTPTPTDTPTPTSTDTPTPTPTWTPSNTPTETFTPTATLTPDPPPPPPSEWPLRLTALCSPDPDLYRMWRIRNALPYDVVVVWVLVGSSAGQSGLVFVPAFGEVFFRTETELGPNTVRILLGGVQHDVKASNPARCADLPPPPTNTPTEEPPPPPTSTATPTEEPPPPPSATDTQVSSGGIPTEEPPTVTDTPTRTREITDTPPPEDTSTSTRTPTLTTQEI